MRLSLLFFFLLHTFLISVPRGAAGKCRRWCRTTSGLSIWWNFSFFPTHHVHRWLGAGAWGGRQDPLLCDPLCAEPLSLPWIAKQLILAIAWADLWILPRGPVSPGFAGKTRRGLMELVKCCVLSSCLPSHHHKHGPFSKLSNVFSFVLLLCKPAPSDGHKPSWPAGEMLCQMGFCYSKLPFRRRKGSKKWTVVVGGKIKYSEWGNQETYLPINVIRPYFTCVIVVKLCSHTNAE